VETKNMLGDFIRKNHAEIIKRARARVALRRAIDPRRRGALARR
jgi:hypothetical protein